MKWIVPILLVLGLGAFALVRSLSGPAVLAPPALGATRPEGRPAEPSPLEANRALRTEAELREALERHRERAATATEPAEVVRALALASDAERRLGDEDAALATADSAVGLDPKDGLAQFVRAKALGRKLQTGGMMYALKNLGTYKAAMARAVELDPDNVDARTEQAAFYLVAPKIAGGDVEIGRQLARALEPAAPERAAWLLVLAFRNEERYAEAEAACREALERFPEDGDLRAALAGVLLEQDRLDEAIVEYERALAGRHDTSYFRAAYEYGRALAEAERDPERALEVFREYAEEAPPGGDFLPPKAGAHWRAGQALERLGRPAEAAAAYRRALELDPDLEEALEALEALEGSGG